MEIRTKNQNLNNHWCYEAALETGHIRRMQLALARCGLPYTEEDAINQFIFEKRRFWSLLTN